MKNNKKAIRTYTRMVTSGSFRLKESDQALWIQAASQADESLSQFLRSALRERAKKILSRARSVAEFSSGGAVVCELSSLRKEDDHAEKRHDRRP